MENVQQHELKTEFVQLQSFSILQGDDGKNILDYLKEKYDLDKPATLPGAEPHWTYYRDGMKTIVAELEWIVNNLPQILEIKKQEMNENA
jgi:hypothetical protein